MLGTDTFFQRKRGGNRILATAQKWDSAMGGWTQPEIVSSIPFRMRKPPPCKIPLHRGGMITIYPKLVEENHAKIVRSELLASGLFRQYEIQGADEPRAHFLLHPDATDDFSDEQPGYHYSTVTLKARPLSYLPRLARLSDEMKSICQVDKWNIGVNPVLYRDGRDKMGDHADNDQGERLILAVLVDSPDETRRVCIRPFSNLERKNSDEFIEIFMQPGDAYQMDGKMQISYSHSVPAAPNLIGNDTDKRIAIVFRVGDEVKVVKDSGRALRDLAPRKMLSNFFGNNISSLQEGHIYKRKELLSMGAHLMAQRGISGNVHVGCDAIIISGLRPDKLGNDSNFIEIMYAAESKVGARSVIKSAKTNRPIRIFRSSGYRNAFRAQSLGLKKSKGSKFYRYDGLYKVKKFVPPKDEKKEPFKFYLERVQAGDADSGSNKISNEMIQKHCENLGTMLKEDERDFVNFVECEHVRCASI